MLHVVGARCVGKCYAWILAIHPIGDAMITLDDCLAFSGLTAAEVQAIAEHEHIPEIAAASLGYCLLCDGGGVQRIRDMILDDIEAARRRGQGWRVEELNAVLESFVAQHPEATARWPITTRIM
jgi:hypothetical protein